MAVATSDAEISKAKQFRQVATLLQKVGNKMEDSYLRSELDGRINGQVVSKTVQAWHRDLLHNLKNVSTPPKVSKSKFRDARKLFGVNCDNKVTLRNPGHLGAYCCTYSNMHV